MKTNEILTFLRPDGGWILVGDDLSNAQFPECEPVTQAELEQGVKNYQKHLSDQATAKQALLDRLGITADEARLLRS
jgi:hypothetical protein